MKTKRQKVKEAEARVVKAAVSFENAHDAGVKVTFEVDGLGWWDAKCGLSRAVAALKKAKGK